MRRGDVLEPCCCFVSAERLRCDPVLERAPGCQTPAMWLQDLKEKKEKVEEKASRKERKKEVVEAPPRSFSQPDTTPFPDPHRKRRMELRRKRKKLLRMERRRMKGMKKMRKKKRRMTKGPR
ncbi:parathymosin [Fukomys damarensis]|uniref:parathymosin n=1 Tax=Fukomys damarensis TaxID=885580 RepID=UPI00145555F4|nr:parathymosin [Fukomys damarensis]